MGKKDLFFIDCPTILDIHYCYFSIPLGQHTLRFIPADDKWMMGRYFLKIPINKEFEVKTGGIYYLGHIEAVLRKKDNPDEFNAGQSIPVIDQVGGRISEKTFDVEITDKYEENIINFIKLHPILENQIIINSALPPWTRPTTKDELAPFTGPWDN